MDFTISVNIYNIYNPIQHSVLNLHEPTGPYGPDSVFFLAPLKFDFFRIFFIGLKWSLGIFRKSQKVSALSFDHKGAKIGDMSIAGPYGPPLCGIGLT